MKKFFTFIVLATLSLTVLAQNKSVAILNPLDRDGSVTSMYKIIVRSSFETVASVTQGYEAFDRTALDAIMSEHNFQRSGAVNDAEIRQIGQMAGVDYVLVTEVSAESDYLVVQAKILNVVTAKYDRAVDDLMQMTPPTVKEGCTVLAQKLFRINMQTGNQKGEIMYDGDRYVGEYRDGKPNGKGKLYYSDENLSTYEGEFVNGKRQGQGTLIWKSGNRYEGAWMDDVREGNGKMYWSDGKKFDGEWRNDKMLNGTCYYTDGSKYVGYFQNGSRHGQGTYYYISGDKYVGQWANGLKNGEGIMYYSDGGRFEGNYTDDKRNGYGVYYYPKGRWSTKDSGTWKMGVRHGRFTEYNENGWHSGSYVDGKKDGRWSCYRNGHYLSDDRYRNGRLL